MKKIISIVSILTIIITFFITGNTYAASLDTLEVDTDKTIVRPGENVKVTIKFGQSLGAYTFKVSYDNNIFDYVSVDGGTENNTSNKVIVTYHDATGGTNPRTNMSIIFKAKENITTSNPTEFTITGEGLANADASVTYDDITVPIVKNVTVEPEYIAYTIKLESTGSIVKEQEKEMTLSYSSPMGRYYQHARLVAEATTPTGASVQLLATDQARLEHDIINSGWGDAQGFAIGGRDVSQVLNVRAIFSEDGDYTITLKLIDRDNSDQVIAQNTFAFTVGEETGTQETTPQETIPQQTTPENTKPKELPKAGNNIYVPIIAVIILLISILYVIKKKNKEQ